MGAGISIPGEFYKCYFELYDGVKCWIELNSLISMRKMGS